MGLIEPSDPREPGENFRFISEVSDIFPSDSFDQSSDKLSLISSAGKLGIVFIANQTSVKVFKSSQLLDEGEKKSPVTSFRTKGFVTHISTSCDGLIFFVVAVVNYTPFGFFYDVCHIMQNVSSLAPFYSIPLSSDIGSRVASLAWNPCDQTCIAIALSTGDLSLLRIKESSVEYNSKQGIGANAVAWSAKGKQLAVGKKDGSLSLFKPDFTHVRGIEAPPLQGVGPVIDITWFTNTEFFVGYLTADNLPVLFYVNAPKAKPATFANFEDVCYSNENGKPVSYYTAFISEWNLLFVLSSNAVEMGLIGRTEKEEGECKWCQWFPDEGARASIHLYNVTEETFPLGLALDFTSQKFFPARDEKPTGPFPALLSLSSKGVLNVFFVENRLNNVPSLNVACENLPLAVHRTPQQFGQPTEPESQASPTPPPPLDLKRNSLSAFSSIAKKTEEESQGAAASYSFSTPIKATTDDVSSKYPMKPSGPLFTFPAVASSTPPISSSFSFNLPSTTVSMAPSSSSPFPFAPSLNVSSSASTTSTTFSFNPASSPINFSFSSSAPFSSPCISKPVSLTSQIGNPSLVVVPSLVAPSPKKSSGSPLPSPQLPLAAPQPLTGSSSQSHRGPDSSPTVMTSGSQPLGASTYSPQPSLVGSAAPLQILPSGHGQQPSHRSPQPEPFPPKISRETLLLRIEKEKDLFERELMELCTMNNSLECQVGTEGENADATTKIGKIRTWMEDMKRTTEELSDEVGNLHQKTLEALSSYEDANSHKQSKFSSRNQVYLQLRPLDPYSQRKLDEVRSKYQYLVSEVSNVNSKLELQWEEYSTVKKPRKLTRERKSVPENLYRSILNLQNKRLSAEKEIERIGQKLKKLSLPFGFSSTAFSPSRDLNTTSALGNTSLPMLSASTPAKAQASPKPKNLFEVLSQRSKTPVRVQPSPAKSVSSLELSKKFSSSPVEKLCAISAEGSATTPSVENASPTVYQDISPSVNPNKSGTCSLNPLAALSSFVGQVSKADQNNMSVSFLSKSAVKSEPFVEAAPKTTFSFSFNQPTKSEPQPSTIKFSNSNSGSLSGFSLGSTGGVPPFPINLSSALSPSASSSIVTETPSSPKINFQGFGSVNSSVPSSASNQSILGSPPTTSHLVAMLSTTQSSSSNFSNYTKTDGPGVTFAPMFSAPVISFGSSTPKPANTLSSVGAASLSSKDGGMLTPLSFQVKSEPDPSQNGTVSSSAAFCGGTSPSSSQTWKEGENVNSSQFGGLSGPSFASSSGGVFSVLGQGSSSISTTSTQLAASSSPMPTNLTSTSSIFGQVPSTKTSVFSLPTSTTIPLTTQTTTTTANTSSLFNLSNSLPKSASGSLFGTPPITTTTTLFNQPSLDIFSQSATISSSLVGQPVSSSASIFTQTAFNLSTGSVFSQSNTKTSSSSVFGQPPSTTTTSALNQSTSNSVPSLFVQPASTSVASLLGQTSSSPSFGGQPVTTASLFGLPSSNSSLFGEAPVSISESTTTTVITPTTATMFDQASTRTFSAFGFTTPTSTQSTIAPPTITTTASSGFGHATPSSSSLFGGVTSSSILFGGSSTPSSSASIFGGTNTPSSSSSIFGGSNTPSSSSSVFNSNPPSSSSYIFGSAATSSQSIFGGPASPSLFSKATPSTEVPKGVFSQTATGTSSAFGSSSAFGEVNSGSVFQSGAFGSGSAFGQQPLSTSSTVASQSQNSASSFSFASPNTSQGFGSPTVTGGGSIFGGGGATSPSGSIFGGAPSTTVVPTTTPSIFGGPPLTAATISNQGSFFGGASTFSSGFGQSVVGSNSVFSSGGSMFGGMGLGKAPCKEDASKNVFGAVKSGSTPQTNIFGGSGSSSSIFGGQATPQKTGGAFSPVKSGGPTFGGVATFGGSPTFGDNKGGNIFGGGAVFGGRGSFGAATTVGGGSSSFGGSSSVFGSKSSAFSPSSSGSGFGSFASTSSGNTASSFGSLANQSGGSSFTSWR